MRWSVDGGGSGGRSLTPESTSPPPKSSGRTAMRLKRSRARSSSLEAKSWSSALSSPSTEPSSSSKVQSLAAVAVARRGLPWRAPTSPNTSPPRRKRNSRRASPSPVDSTNRPDCTIHQRSVTSPSRTTNSPSRAVTSRPRSTSTSTPRASSCRNVSSMRRNAAMRLARACAANAAAASGWARARASATPRSSRSTRTALEAARSVTAGGCSSTSPRSPLISPGPSTPSDTSVWSGPSAIARASPSTTTIKAPSSGETTVSPKR